jgi:hypothetical protein
MIMNLKTDFQSSTHGGSVSVISPEISQLADHCLVSKNTTYATGTTTRRY